MKRGIYGDGEERMSRDGLRHWISGRKGLVLKYEEEIFQITKFYWIL